MCEIKFGGQLVLNLERPTEVDFGRDALSNMITTEIDGKRRYWRVPRNLPATQGAELGRYLALIFVSKFEEQAPAMLPWIIREFCDQTRSVQVGFLSALAKMAVVGGEILAPCDRTLQ